MTPQTLKRLREQGLTLATIGRFHCDPPVSRERVRQLCMRYGITNGQMKLRGPRKPNKSVGHGEYRLPTVDPERAQAITAEKQAFWRGKPSPYFA